MADHVLHPVPDGGEGGGKPRGIHRIALVDVGIQGDLPVTGHHEGQAELAQIEAFLLGVAPLGDGGALIAAGQVGEKVGGVVDKGVQFEVEVIDHGAGELCLDGLQRHP